MGGIITEVGADTLESRLNVTGLVLLYTQVCNHEVIKEILCIFILSFQAISWFVNVGLLPEQPESQDSPVPISVLDHQYWDKRRQLARSQGHHGRPCLLVDILCQVDNNR